MIEHAARIVSFRNILIHGYDLIDDARAWQTIQADLPALQRQVEDILQSCGE